MYSRGFTRWVPFSPTYPAEIEKLAQQILNPLREAELELAKHLELLVEKDKIRAALEDDIPSAYQNEAKAYFEAVGKGRK